MPNLLRFTRLGSPAVLAFWLVACSPPFNWRELRPAGTPLQATLPCKPDDAMRRVPLAGGPTDMHLSGCDAGGATFVIGWAAVPVERLGAALGDWQDTTLARAGIPSGPDAPVGRPFQPPGALALPQSVRIAATGRAPDGDTLPLQAAWFATAGSDGAPAQAFFAAVYRAPDAPDAADAFFAGLRLR